MSQTQLLTLETVSDGPPLPATIGKYRVLGRLGEGATSEVFLAFDDVKISDFGSVLNLGSDVTQIYRVGSLAYMSPEQLDGGTLDFRADMYSLGAVLYHLIAGRPTFDGAVQSAMMQQIYHAKPAALTGARAGVSAGLDAVIQQALAKDPAKRFASWNDFAQALSSLITTQQVPRGQMQGVLD